MPANRLGILLDLDRQFAGGRDDQRARITVFAFSDGRRGQQAVHHRNQKCCRLAGAGLRLAGDITSRQRDRQRHVLDRRATREPAGGDTLLQQGMQIKGSKKRIGENSL